MNILTVNLLMSTLVFGVVSYDSPASLLGSFGVPEAAEIGAKLEGKLQDLLTRCL